MFATAGSNILTSVTTLRKGLIQFGQLKGYWLNFVSISYKGNALALLFYVSKLEAYCISCFRLNRLTEIKFTDSLSLRQTLLSYIEEIERLMNYNFHFRQEGNSFPDWPKIYRTIKAGGKQVFTQRVMTESAFIIMQLVNEKFSNKSFLGAPRLNLYPRLFNDFPREVSIVFVSVRWDTITFMSCYGVSISTTFHIYAHPYQMNVWICILIAIILLSFGMYRDVPKPWRQISYLLLLTIGSLLENIHLSWNLNLRLKFFIMPWLLIVVVLSNAYKGILTSDLTAPKPNTGLQMFEELDDVFLYPEHDIPPDLPILNQTGNVFFKDSNELLVRTCIGPPGLFMNLFYSGEIGRKSHLPKSLLKNKKMYDYILERLVLPPKISVEEVVSQCDKSGFLDFRSKILDFRVPKSRQKTLAEKPFILAKDSIFSTIYGWSADNTMINGLTGFLNKLVLTGFYSWIE
ncbi:unnamed protein product, partial [Allacma fusca]